MVAPASSVFILGHDGRRQLPWPICIIPPQTDDGRVRVMDIRAAIARELKTHHFSLHDISTNNSLLSGLSASEGTEPIVDERIYTDGLPEPLKTLDMVSSHAVLIGCLSIPPPAPLVPLPLTAPREDQSILELANLSSSVNRLPTPEPSEVPRQFRNSSATPPREPAGELERPVLRLPPEILHLIFLRATAPALLLSPDDLRPQSAWNLNLRTQLRLISVCRDWNDAGVTLLYENIAIHSIGQLCALIATLRDNSYLSERVHSLCFACIVPDVPTNYQAMFERIADTLPILCPNLVNLSLRIPCPNKGAASSICSHFGSLLLTHLEPLLEHKAAAGAQAAHRNCRKSFDISFAAFIPMST
ncbi:hypothetical protein D9757_006084 [Collybiopsis confluens]|uniref:F-box domain-containing protein n=1 Tax=Collybiopsis confluens TaxID=2823264 RepID=A0A8H5M6V0_9AGAR|nr:hypothetical protein D9757_006084 [Collybiopsis confluens]